MAHPGHELRVFGWLESNRPLLFVLTDGSGHSGVSRLESTTKIATQTGATPGGIYGKFSDADIYRALLNHDFELFIKLAEELAERLVSEKTASVAGDASEGYNSGHEACRLIIDAAVEMARVRHDHVIENFDFRLVGPPCERYRHECDFGTRLYLDEEAFARKMVAIYSYPELAAEVEAQLSKTSLDFFRTECLHQVDRSSLYESLVEAPPFYEQYGEQQVAAGLYREVIRHREHLRPLADALRQSIERAR